jgi:hypothetical protein
VSKRRREISDPRGTRQFTFSKSMTWATSHYAEVTLLHYAVHQPEGGRSQPPLAARAIAGIESGHFEIRPGLSNVLKAMSRIAPQFMLKQMTKMAMLKQ